MMLIFLQSAVNLVLVSTESTRNSSSSHTVRTQNPIPSFADLQLQQVFQRDFLNTSLDTGNGEVVRSAKRPRISDQKADNGNKDYESSPVARLSNVLGALEPQNLASLPEIARYAETCLQRKKLLTWLGNATLG